MTERFINQTVEMERDESAEKERLFLENAFKVYLQANIRFPQRFFNRTIGFFMLDELISVYPTFTEDASTQLTKEHTAHQCLTPEQIETLLTATRAAHTKHSVKSKYGDLTFSEDESGQRKRRLFISRLQGLWSFGLTHMCTIATDFVSSLSGAKTKEDGMHPKNQYTEQQWDSSWPYIVRLTPIIKEVINSEGSRELVETYRQLVKERMESGDTDNSKEKDVDEEHYRFVLGECTKRFGEIYPEIDFSEIIKNTKPHDLVSAEDLDN